ncbi:MAG: heavy metal translocating P-type ATPase [Prochlorococcus sp. SP3034]|nr:heavy metal translocating P-type ATPase [Prochlorococcus sp. SP3034]|tara:strand:+ start:2729 stop:5026 length:2298 start_codon:yes stop_codon:yes gene_type:complete
MKSIQLNISGMKCGGCVETVEKILKNSDGTENVSVNLITESAYFDIKNNQINIEDIIKNLDRNGFPSKIYSNDFSEKINKAALLKKNLWFKEWKKLNFAFILLLFSVLGHLAEGGYINLPVLGNIYFHAGLASTALLFPGRSIIIKGFNSFFRNKPNMDTLVALGVTSAYSTSLLSLLFPSTGFPCFFNEPVMLLGFIILGRFLEDRAKYQTGSSIGELLDLQPETASIIDSNGQIKDVRVNTLMPGDEIQLLAGDRVPADCLVLNGNSLIDVSHITGESKPVQASKGENLLNGSLNLNSTLRLKVIKVGADTSLAKLVNLIESTQSKKPPIQRLADKLAGKFTYFVLFASITSFFFWWKFALKIWPNLLIDHKNTLLTTGIHSLHNSLGMNADSSLNLALQLSIAVLVIACPCALGLATPTVITVASGKAAKKGILFKGGDKIEIASKINTVIFDKTGTLTQGCPFIVDYQCSSNNKLLLQVSASLEKESRHPIASALIREAESNELEFLEIIEITNETGKGISGKLETISGEVKVGNIKWLQDSGVIFDNKTNQIVNSEKTNKHTVIGVSIDNHLLGFVLIGDLLREDTKESINRLKKDNFNLYIFSGDRKETVLEIGKMLNFEKEKLKWNLLPQDKLKNIELLKHNNKVAMVGDGINDAPALAASDLGIAVGSGTQIAKANADVVLMGDKLSGLHYGMILAKKTINKIRQNLFWAFGYNLIAIPLAAGVLYPKFGILLSPSIAALLMAISSITVVLNALSLD